MKLLQIVFVVLLGSASLATVATSQTLHDQPVASGQAIAPALTYD